MPTLTDKYIRGLKPRDGRFEVRDLGCPGLLLRVNANGTKTWECVASHAGRRRRVRLGTYPDISLAAARRLASERRSAPSLFQSQMRVCDLWEIYAKEVGGTRRSFSDVQSCWSHWADAAIGTVRLEDLSRRHGAELVEHVARKSSPNRARKVILNLRPMLEFAVGRGLLEVNPWSALHLPEGVAARDRVLKPAEWTAVRDWAVAKPYPWGPFLLTLMLTAQRLNEVAGMRWDEIDGDLWTVPGSRHKSGRAHEVPLPRQVAGILAAQPHVSVFVFSSTPAKPIVPGSKLLRDIKSGTKTSDWRFHDLRRTAATRMTERGVTRFAVERVLGHTDQSVTARYDRNAYREEKRAALARLEFE